MSKKLRPAIVIALVAATCGFGAPVRNLAPNPRFEIVENGKPTGYGQSVLKGKLQFLVAPDDRRGQCLVIQSTDPDAVGAWAADVIRVVGGSQLDVSVAVKLDGVDPVHDGAGAMLTFHFYRDGQYKGWAYSAGRIGTSDWADLTHTVRVPTDVNEARIGLRLSKAKGAVWFDDLRIMGVPGPPRKESPAVTSSGTRGQVALFQQRTHKDVDTIISHFHHEQVAVDHFHRDNIAAFPADAAGLAQYVSIFYSSLALEGGVKLLSDHQQQAIVDYVRNGGGFCCMVGDLTGSKLQALLPIDVARSVKGRHFIRVVAEPAHPILRDVPKQWPGFGSKYNAYSEATLRPLAQALMYVPEAVAPPARRSWPSCRTARAVSWP